MLVLALLLVLSPWNARQDQPKSADPEHHPKSHTSEAPSVAAPLPPSATPPTQIEISYQQQYSSDKPKGWIGSEWVMVILTAIYVGFTGFYAHVSHKTLKAIERQEIKQAEAARNRERPWLLITLKDELFYRQELDSNLFGDKLTVELQSDWYVTNHGKTPAIIREVASIFRMVTPEEFTAIKEGTPDYRETSTFDDDSVIVAPQKVHNWSGVSLQPHTPTAQSEKDDIRNRKVLLIAYGIVKYTDVIGTRDTPPYESRFLACWRFKDDLMKGGFAYFAGFGDYTKHT